MTLTRNQDQHTRHDQRVCRAAGVGHTVAVGAAFGGFEDGDPVTLTAAVITYPLLAVMIATGVLGEGRALHDRVAGTVVSSGSVRLSG